MLPPSPAFFKQAPRDRETSCSRLHSQGDIEMEKKYWIGRKRAAMAMARAATSAEARLIHYDLAGRYSLEAARGIPFMMPRKGPATPGEGVALLAPLPGPASPLRAPRAPRDRRGPDGAEDGR